MSWKPIDINELKKTLLIFKNKDETFKRFALAAQVLTLFMGPKWFNDNLTGAKKGDFLHIGNEGIERFNFQYRVEHLAYLLYDLQKCEGFEDFLETLKHKKLDAISWELYTAGILFENEYKVTFIKEQGKMGSDYDLSAEKEVIYNVEAKLRINVLDDPSSLKNALNKAYKQLPKDANGIIFIKLNLSFNPDEKTGVKIISIIDAFFRNTNRVKFVVIFWEQFLESPFSTEGKVLVSKFKIFRSPKADPKLEFDLEEKAEIVLPKYWIEANSA